MGNGAAEIGPVAPDTIRQSPSAGPPVVSGSNLFLTCVPPVPNTKRIGLKKMKLMDNTNSEQDTQIFKVADARQNEKELTRVGTAAEKTGNGFFSYRWWKRGLDCALALPGLVIISPLLAAIAIMIRLDSPGSPIFRQERVGKDERRFMLYKFRSMYTNNDDSKYKAFIARYVQENYIGTRDDVAQDIYERIKDPRVTKVGRGLRKTNLDELPQLFNILKGEMSFVGPRPDIPFAVDMYKDHHKKRFNVMPGLTGLWQASGRKQLTFEEMIQLDMEYIDKQSLFLDIKILFLTVGAFLRGEGS